MQNLSSQVLAGIPSPPHWPHAPWSDLGQNWAKSTPNVTYLRLLEIIKIFCTLCLEELKKSNLQPIFEISFRTHLSSDSSKSPIFNPFEPKSNPILVQIRPPVFWRGQTLLVNLPASRVTATVQESLLSPRLFRSELSWLCACGTALCSGTSHSRTLRVSSRRCWMTVGPGNWWTDT